MSILHERIYDLAFEAISAMGDVYNYEAWVDGDCPACQNLGRSFSAEPLLGGDGRVAGYRCVACGRYFDPAKDAIAVTPKKDGTAVIYRLMPSERQDRHVLQCVVNAITTALQEAGVTIEQ